MSYLPAASPGMIVSNVALTSFAFRPMTLASALPRSASIPTTVWPSGPMNSFGAYVASDATVSVPFDLVAAGTSLATAASAPPLEDVAAGVEVEVDVAAGAALEDELLLLLLLPHAAMAATLSSDSAASAGFLQITIRLLLVLTPQ